MKRNSNTSKGSILTEAAIVLPVLILALAMLLLLITQVGYEDRMYAEGVSQANSLMLFSDCDQEAVTSYLKVKSEDRKSAAEICYRSFCGSSESFRSMDGIVYVYKSRGVRYHNAACSTLINKSDFTAMSLEDAEKCGYTPCLLCYGDGEDYFLPRE